MLFFTFQELNFSYWKFWISWLVWCRHVSLLNVTFFFLNRILILPPPFLSPIFTVYMRENLFKIMSITHGGKHNPLAKFVFFSFSLFLRYVQRRVRVQLFYACPFCVKATEKWKRYSFTCPPEYLYSSCPHKMEEKKLERFWPGRKKFLFFPYYDFVCIFSSWKRIRAA